MTNIKNNVRPPCGHGYCSGDFACDMGAGAVPGGWGGAEKWVGFVEGWGAAIFVACDVC